MIENNNNNNNEKLNALLLKPRRNFLCDAVNFIFLNIEFLGEIGIHVNKNSYVSFEVYKK